ncbi:MAG: nucleotidyltransferase family protein [Aestuariivirga sp.]
MKLAWRAIVLAAGRGPDDPMAKAFGVVHKCLLPVGGVAMLKRVIDALAATKGIDGIAISIDDSNAADQALGEGATRVSYLAPQSSAPASAKAGADGGSFPLLITTGDHALLTREMICFFCGEAEASGADFCAGLATAETILAAYPETRRTFFSFGRDRVSGCNLFAVMTPAGLKVLERWQYLDQLRKKPWRLVLAFGLGPLIKFALGRLSLADAFRTASSKLGIFAKPVLMPFAEAAIDVDKPADKELVEMILRQSQPATK